MANEVFELTGPDAKATGLLCDNGFLVKAGALARRETAPSAKGVAAVHAKLLAEGIVIQENGSLRFQLDHTFRSPSGAAAAILGRTANGWISWKLPDGRTLSDVERIARSGTGPILPEPMKVVIADRYAAILQENQLLPLAQLQVEDTLFRARFGPAALAELDGEALLTQLHDHGNHDSLVYWLEFKNDEEFQTRNRGSIAGGSALKFGIFRRKETGMWQKGGGQANQPQDIALAEAVKIARQHRDQLLRGCELLQAFPSDATDEDYAELQDQMDELAPDVSRLAWGHKYFSILFPDKLDDYHNPDLQRFHLLKLLQLPPAGDGRYVCAGRFVTAAKEAALHMNHFTFVLNAIHGKVHRYWRIGTRSGHDGTHYWPLMRDKSCVAIGWSDLGDISWVDGKKESIDQLKAKLSANAPESNATSIGKAASQLSQFAVKIGEGDVVVAADGMTILGVGRVVGDYTYSGQDGFAHQRPVEWLSIGDWRLPTENEGLQSTVRTLKKPNNLLAIEERIQSAQAVIQEGKVPVVSARLLRLSGLPGRIQSILERKGQVILYGPPGTGKTYWADRAANDLAALAAFGRLFDSLSEPEKIQIVGTAEQAGLVRFCCFHPGYGYEDFLEGYRPRPADEKMGFQLQDGVFKRLCADARQFPDRNFYLIVDEINRGDIPRIFGELLTVLEKDKRGKRITLPVSQDIFSIPDNVFLIGTMNTADRSISLLDAALRRRFGFVELMPDTRTLQDASVGGIPLRAWLEAVNANIRTHIGRDARNLQIGHAYLMHRGRPISDFSVLKRVIRDDVLPLLEEYCYEDFSTLVKIVGAGIIDVAGARIREDLFEEGKETTLTDALLSSLEGIPILNTTSDSHEIDEDLGEDAEENDA